MSESVSTSLHKASMLQKALEKANGPIDAEHLAYIIMLATADEQAEAEQEQAELDFLLILLIHEIRHKKPGERSFESLYELLNENEASAIEKILKISAFWKLNGGEQSRRLALAGVKARLLQVLLADDPDFVPE